MTESLPSAEAIVTPLSALQQWRQTYFGTTANAGDAADSADPDGDGMTNAREFAAGTAPDDSTDVLRASIELDSPDIIVSFPSVIGRAYRIEKSDTLAAGSWTPLLDDIAGTGGVIEIADPGAASLPRRFYRIVLIP